MLDVARKLALRGPLPRPADSYLRHPMSELAVVSIRSVIAESRHRVSAAVVTTDGRLVADAGDPDTTTFWRSATKPFQLLPLVEDGGVEAFGLDRAMLALACGSHNAEAVHRAAGARWLSAVGVTEADLACAGHPSLSPRIAQDMIRDRVDPTPLWSNCSGKHAAMLALARRNGWSLTGYERRGHPVQDRVEATVSRWTATPRADLTWGIDGCTAAAVALPVRAMALGYARLGTSAEPAAVMVRDAMMAEPYMVGGEDRLDTILMQAWAGRIIVKIGAEGVYSAALPGLGVGVALKVEDGDMKCAGLALLSIVLDVTARLDPGGSWPIDALDAWRSPVIRNTRGEPTGRWDVTGALHFS